MDFQSVSGVKAWNGNWDMEKPGWDLHVQIPGSAEPHLCPRGDSGLNQRFGAFFPQKWEGTGKGPALPYSHPRNSPHKVNSELF